MQSLRQPLRSLPSLVLSSRHFASSSRISFPAQTPAPDTSAAESSDSGLGGFSALTTALAPETRNPYSASTSSIYSSPSAHTPERAEAIRGYTEAIPPQIDPLLDIFTNMLMKHGRKAEAQSNVSDILTMLQKTANQPAQPLLARAITLSSPSVRLNSTRRRAKLVQTPKALDERQRTRQGIVWLLKAAERGRKAGLPRNQRIAREVFAVLEGNSEVYKWVEERHRLATANRSNLNTGR